MEDLGLDYEIAFFVPGIPAPGGSKRFVGFGKKTGRAILIDDAGQRNRNWRAMVGAIAFEHKPKALLRGPLEVSFGFVMPRIKAHFHTSQARKGDVKANAPLYHTSKPDGLKLARSTEDALTGIIWLDDSQTVRLHITKTYGDTPGCAVLIRPIQI